MKTFLTLITLVFSITFPVSALAMNGSLVLAPAPGGIENTGEIEYGGIFPEEPGRGDISSSETAEGERFVALLNEAGVPAVDPFLAGISAAITLGTGNNTVAGFLVILALSLIAYFLFKPYRNS